MPAARSIGVVGEVDPGVLEAFGLDAERRRVGWLEVDLDVLLIDAPRAQPAADRRSAGSPRATWTWPSWWTRPCPPPRWRRRCAGPAGELLESLALFDVYRGVGMPPGTRSLAYRLRLCAPDRTLTDEEVAAVRARCIAAVEQAHGARLRS